MPSRFLQAIGVERASDEEREARGRAARTSRHSSRVGRLPSSRHRSTKLRTKERHSRSIMSATTGSESERKSRKKSTIRSNSGKKRSPRRREETEVERLARRRERKEDKMREAEGSMVGETGVMEDEAQAVPSVEDEEPTSAGLGILCDIPQQQTVDVFQFQSDWSDDEDAKKGTAEQTEFTVESVAHFEDHPAEYESATDGHETYNHQQEGHAFDDHHLQEVHTDTENQPSVEDENSLAATTDEPAAPTEPRRSLAASVADETEDVPTPMPRDFNFSPPNRTLSSGSSFVSSSNTHFSEPHDDAETERSTSPETSFKSPSPIHASPQVHDTPTQPGREEAERPETSSAAKLAAQTLAAEHRQRTIRRRSSHHMRRPEMQRHCPSAPELPYQNPWIPTQALSPIPHYNPTGQGMQMSPHIPAYPPAPSPMQMSPRIPLDAHGHPPPITGYASLASALSPSSQTPANPASAIFQPEQTLPPLYRRFASLNHRLLLHLQDELSELEEELAYLDGLDTAQRTHASSAPGRLVIRPASRREAALTGSELEWRRGDVMGRISAKLHLYNETLASFQKTEALAKAKEEDIEQYGEYLATKRPLIEAESNFIDHVEDLVSLAPKRLHSHANNESGGTMRLTARPQRRLTATAHNTDEQVHIKHTIRKGHEIRQQHEQTLWLSALISILLPILVFHIIPDFMGRMVVALLIGLGIVGLLVQTGATGLLALGRGGKRVVAGVWAGGMMVLALIV